MGKDRICQAPFHVPGCSGFGVSLDHFTPRCIAIMLGWTKQQIDSEENTQWLSLACHTSKDTTTEERKKLLVLQLDKIRAITIEDVRRWARNSAYNNIDKEGINKAVLRKIMLLTNHSRRAPLNWPYEYMPIVYNRTSGKLEDVC